MEFEPAHACQAPDHEQLEHELAAGPASKWPASSDSSQTRSVRLIYFLPNDRTFNPDMVDSMKARILRIRTFFRDQIQSNGKGSKTFENETDARGAPVVHRVDASYFDDSYLRSYRIVGVGNVFRDLRPTFVTTRNIFFIVVDHSTYDNLGWGNVAGFGGRWADNRGYALLPASFIVETAAHELGHAFGLQHDFNDGANIMSYGPRWNRLAACSAGLLSVHPYFQSYNSDQGISAWIRPGGIQLARRRVDLTAEISSRRKELLGSVQRSSGVERPYKGLEISLSRAAHTRVSSIKTDSVMEDLDVNAYALPTGFARYVTHWFDGVSMGLFRTQPHSLCKMSSP